MQNDIWNGFEVFSNTLLPIALSFVACLVRQAKYGWHGLRQFLRELVICSFMGVIIYWSLDYVDFPPTVDAAITSGGSFASLTIIDAIMDKALSIIKNWRGKGEV